MRPASVHVGRDFRSVLARQVTSARCSAWACARLRGAAARSRHGRGLAGHLDPHSRACRRRRHPGGGGAAGPSAASLGHRCTGRGEGAKLGFPTANIAPGAVRFASRRRVYAGRAILEDRHQWAAAISVGTPPSFPEARDDLEAHLVDFEGDLYDRTRHAGVLRETSRSAGVRVARRPDAAIGALRRPSRSPVSRTIQAEGESRRACRTSFFAHGELDPLPEDVDAEALDSIRLRPRCAPGSRRRGAWSLRARRRVQGRRDGRARR